MNVARKNNAENLQDLKVLLLLFKRQKKQIFKNKEDETLFIRTSDWDCS